MGAVLKSPEGPAGGMATDDSITLKQAAPGAANHGLLMDQAPQIVNRYLDSVLGIDLRIRMSTVLARPFIEPVNS